MIIHGKIRFKEAIIVNEKLLRDLEKVILQFFKKIKYECRLCTDDYILFNSLEELLNYENNKKSRIEKLVLEFDYNKIEFYTTVSYFCSYGCTVVGSYKVETQDENILFSKKVMEVLEKSRRNKLYTFFTKISILYFMVFILVISSASTIYLVMKEGLKGGNIYTTNSINLGITIGILIFFIGWILAKCRNLLFPPISFMLGEQIEQIKKNEDRTSKIFWGVIVAFVISYIVTKIA